MIAWRDLAVSSVPILGLKEHPQKSIMSEDSESQGDLLPSYLYVPSIIEVIQDCMDSEQKNLRSIGKLAKKIC